MLNFSMEQLLEAGVHFGHQKSRWNPKMRPYIFGIRNGIHIIDLRKTLAQLQEGYEIMRKNSSRGNVILFVGTKRQIKDIIAEEAKRADVFWVSERWLGGTLTNFRTIRQSVQKLKQIEKMFEDGTVEQLTKKERNILATRRDKLNNVLEGIREMERLPDVMYIVDTVHEKTAVAEARKLGIYIIGLVDTNSDPDNVDFPIPGNDDAIKSVKLITTALADAVLDGRTAGQLGSSFKKRKTQQESAGETVEAVGDTSEQSEEESEQESSGQPESPSEQGDETPQQKSPDTPDEESQ